MEFNNATPFVNQVTEKVTNGHFSVISNGNAISEAHLPNGLKESFTVPRPQDHVEQIGMPKSILEQPQKEIPDTRLIFCDIVSNLLRYQLQLCSSDITNVNHSDTTTATTNGTINMNGAKIKSSNGEDCQTNSASSTKTKAFPILYDTQNRPFNLQPSLFPLMYPTVYFSAEDDISDVPQETRPFLRWKMTTITANTMKSIVSRSGYKIMPLDRKNRNLNNWNAVWCKHLRISEFQSIGYYQRVNHFPGSFNYGRKDRLSMNLKNKIEKHGQDFGNFHPPTFVIPQDYPALVSYWKSNDSISKNLNTINSNENGNGELNQMNGIAGDMYVENGVNQDIHSTNKFFICKPPASARGQGINIVTNLQELHNLMAQHNAQYQQNSNSRKPKVSMVVQEYISNPCLLHNDAKFDLRVYVLITSIMPLRVYVYDEGLVRFAANRYNKNISDIQNQFIHLTNYSVNKNCIEYVPNKSIDGQDGHKWTLKTLWRYLAMTRNIDVDQIWEQIIDLITKTVISAESNILTLLNLNLKNKKSCFELLGFDIMLDENLKLWLIEVNITPSLRADSILDFSVKNQLIKDILNTLGYHLSPRFRRHYNFGHLLSPEKSDFLHKMMIPDEEKHQTFERIYKEQGLESCLKDILNDLKDDDVLNLMESEDEFNRCGKLRRVFPTSDSGQFLKYFDQCHYYNLLLIAWEEKYHLNRWDGIQRLRSYMSKKEVVRDNVDILKAQLIDLERSKSNLRQAKFQNSANSSVEND